MPFWRKRARAGCALGARRHPQPPLFNQIRAEQRGGINSQPRHEVLNYLHPLWEHEITPGVRELSQVQRMKKFTNFIGEGIGENVFARYSPSELPSRGFLAGL